MKKKKLAVVGATGLVGQTILKCLREQNLLGRLDIYLISNHLAGKFLIFGEHHYYLFALSEQILEENFDYAIFAVDEQVSKNWAQKFVDSGAIVIDNSSAFRLKKQVPLVVPEINFDAIGDSHIIANPNCSTIQLVLVLDRLRQIAPIKKVVVSSYQSVSGAGKAALDELEHGGTNIFEKGIKDNIIAKIGSIDKFGNSTEENKIVLESKKILNSDFEIFATAVRVPIAYCHGESVYVEFDRAIDFEGTKEVLSSTSDIVFSEDVVCPTEVAGSNKTYVYRLRKFGENKLGLFILADNLRRGAAYNAVKILEFLEQMKH